MKRHEFINGSRDTYVSLQETLVLQIIIRPCLLKYMACVRQTYPYECALNFYLHPCMHA